jgi:hypothetical protein
MFFPVVALGSAIGLVWGIIERKKGQKPSSGSMTGLVLNGLIVGLPPQKNRIICAATARRKRESYVPLRHASFKNQMLIGEAHVPAIEVNHWLPAQ